MSRELHRTSLVRTLCLWSLVTAGATATPLGLAVELHLARSLLAGGTAGVPFDAMLAAGAAATVAASAAWFWVVTTLTLGLALRGHHGRVPGCPDGVRRVLLATCGLAVIAAAAPAIADQTAGRPPSPDPPHVLAGLPYPDRAAAGPTPDRTPDAPRPTGAVRVVAEDTLWGIARRRLPQDASPAAVDREWRGIWRANRSTVGADPDLIRPGTTLHLPTKES